MRKDILFFLSTPPPQKITYAQKIPEELLWGGMQQIRVINSAKELSEHYFRVSYVNFA